jgi:hypothetical protein
MAMFQCEKHGLQGVKCVCPHIQESIINDSDLNLNRICRDDLLIPILWLCEECSIAWEVINDEDTEEEFIETMKMICGACFDEWRNNLKT